MKDRGTYPNWILPAVCVVFVTGVVAVGLGSYFFVPELREEAVQHSAFLLEKAKAAGTVVEERPEVRARLEQKYPARTSRLKIALRTASALSLWGC